MGTLNVLRIFKNTDKDKKKYVSYNNGMLCEFVMCDPLVDKCPG